MLPPTHSPSTYAGIEGVSDWDEETINETVNRVGGHTHTFYNLNGQAVGNTLPTAPGQPAHLTLVEPVGKRNLRNQRQLQRYRICTGECDWQMTKHWSADDQGLVSR
jgi:hypothetical protein